MKRIDAIREIMDEVTDEFVITSTGMISREVFMVKDRERNFYVTGSMGASLGIGIGIAANVKKDVLVIAGDGDILMSLGTVVLMQKLKLPNLKLVILDNNSYASTGGQQTCSDGIDLDSLYNCVVYRLSNEKGTAPRITLTHNEIMRRFKNAITREKNESITTTD